MKKLAFALSNAVLVMVLTVPAALAQIASPAAPIQLKPTSNAPITLHMTNESKAIYLALGKLAGINVIFDPDYQSRHGVQVDTTNNTLAEALRIVGETTNTSAKPVAPDTIFVFANTHQKHTDFDDQFDRTLYLKNSTQQADANEVLTAMRNMLGPDAKVYLVASDDAIVLHTTEQNIDLAQKLINELDLPRKSYRLTYTVSAMDGSKLVGTQHYNMVVVAGQETVLKQGSKVPIATGSYNPTDSKSPEAVQTQFTYLDVGMNFDAKLDESANGVRLNTSVEQSSVGGTNVISGVSEPVIRQSSLKGAAYLTPGKPLVLGSIDIPDTTRRLDIEVVMERLP